MAKMFTAWREQSAKLETGDINKEEYNKWCYRYPEFDTTQQWAKVPSKELSDFLIKELDKNK